MFGLNYCGKLKPKQAGEVKRSRLGIGLEKLDRALYDPNPCYDPIAQLGVKWVRIQSGWCRTEKEKGVYDFSWLDEIVDNLLARDLIPWVCLCYGNELYTKDAVNAYGAVGRPPIFTEEEKQAWSRYVSACAAHFKGRVSLYEVWNEPDGKWCWRHGPDAVEYGNFAVETAKAVHAADPEAKMIAGSCYGNLSFFYGMLTTGLAEHIDYVTYHRYQHAVENGTEQFTECLRGILNLFNPNIKIIQGETGAQSAYSTQGALKRGNWTMKKQAKFLLRKMMVDLFTEAEFTSYFSTSDIFENISTDSGTITKDYYGFFGVLGAEFDNDGIPTGAYYKKDAYTAYQSLCAVMSGDVKKTALPVFFSASNSTLVGHLDEDGTVDTNGIYRCGFTLDDGTKAFTYWKATDVMTTDFESTVSVNVCGMGDNVKLIDLYDGSVYTVAPDYMNYENGVLKLNHIPIRDYPLLLVFGNVPLCD